MTSDESAEVLDSLLDWLATQIQSLLDWHRNRHLPSYCPYLNITFTSTHAKFFIKPGVRHMAMAKVVFDVPIAPANPNDAVTARSLVVTIDGTASAPVDIPLGSVTFDVPTVLTTGQVVVATLTDTNTTGSRVVGTVSKSVPDLTPGNLPLDATGLDITFIPDAA